MSLNGLDDVTVKEAHESAAGEPGGWFLLKYASRDEVELLGKGNGGIVEVRNAIAAYEEPSPLFGFLRYRRRTVILKYVPEDCSRLVKVRLGVHFNAVTEALSPYDTIFELVSAKDLKDSKLSAACSLHTASGSISSSTSSLRRRRLMEITEEEEDEHRAKRQSVVVEEKPVYTDTSLINVSPPLKDATSATPYFSDTVPETSTPQTDYRSIIADLETTPPPPREPTNLDIPRPESPTTTIDDGRRKSSQSIRPEFQSYSSYGSNGKSRVKLGPRPSLDVGSRPHTSSSAQFRPVSSLPAGLKLSKSPSRRKERPQTQHDKEPPSMTISPPAIMESQLFTPQTRSFTASARPTTSSGVSVRPLPSPSSIAPSQKFPSMTPEKARLMKALELRKKRDQIAALSDSPTPAARDVPLPEDTALPVVEERPSSEEKPKEDPDTLKLLTDLQGPSKKDVAFDARSTTRTDESDATRSDTFSPTESSELAQSTRASSISESTDETVQEPKESASTPVMQDPVPIETNIPQNHAAHANDASNLQILLPRTYSPSPPTLIVPVIAPTQDTRIQEESARSSDLSPQQNISAAPDEKELSKNNLPENSTSSNTLHVENERPPSTATIERKVPTSKFSSSNLKADAGDAERSSQLPAAVSIDHAINTPQLVIDNRDSKDSKGSKKKKRHGLINPIRTDIDYSDRSAANSDAHISSDEDLMDELHLAVVQEAKPMSVSKSPVSPVFPSPEKTKRFSRTFSNPLRKDSQAPRSVTPPQSEKRTVSAGAAFLNKISQQQDKPLQKKVNVGSGISQRIKALEKLSTTTSASPPTLSTSNSGTSTAFFSVRKASVRDASHTSLVSVADRANSLSRNTPSPSTSREGSPDVSRFRDRSGSVKAKADAFRGSPIPMSKYNQPSTDFVSVTAKIVRDPGQSTPTKVDGGRKLAEPKPTELKQSPLIISRERTAPTTPQPAKDVAQERRMSKESSRSSSRLESRERRSSINVIKDFISEGRTSFSERRRSMNIESSMSKSPPKSPTRPPSTQTNRPMSISGRLSFSSRDQPASSPTFTTGSSSSTNEEKSEKKSSRTSRMMKRMSSSMSSTRKTLSHAMSPTVREEFEPAQDSQARVVSPAQTVAPSPTLISLGEVNVQFPDSLLWKRRSMALDPQGFLVLTAVGTSKDKQGTRRFHLGEFRRPEIPDVEMQELPNSVVLDFKEGGGLQVACEDRTGQARVLKTLQDAHQTWSSY